MVITVRDVSDDEIRLACEIESRAYATNDLGSILGIGAPTPEAVEKRIQAIIDLRKEDPTVIYKQAFDEEAGRMIGFAKWVFLDTPNKAATFFRPIPNFGTGPKAEACTFFFGSLAQRQKELMGSRPYLFLHYLHTDPEFQCRGAGRQLVNWGKEKADSLGIPIYLESSTSVHQFYKNLGFSDIELCKVDLRKFDGPVHEQPMMIREPVKSG